VRSALVAIRKGPSRCAKLGPIRNSRLTPIFTKRISPQSVSRTGSGGSGLPTRGR